MVDIATRVYNHNWKIDPIVRSVLDNDFYKLLMTQTLFRHGMDTHVKFSVINRTKDVPLARRIAESELREQLDHIRTLRLTRGESTWIRGNRASPTSSRLTRPGGETTRSSSGPPSTSCCGARPTASRGEMGAAEELYRRCPPFLQTALHTVPMELRDWGLIALVAAPVFLLAEGVKWVRTRSAA